MTSPQYFIKSTNGSTADAQVHVTVQVDTNGVTVLRATEQAALDLQYFKLDAADADQHLSDLEEILSTVAKNGIKTILFNGPESTLVPEELYAEDISKEITALLHGDLSSGKVSSDHVAKWQLHNVYRISAGMQEFFQKNYPQAELQHFVSSWLGCMKREYAQTVFELIIHPSHFLVALISDSKLQFLQRFVYESDEDLLFFLLTICRECDVDPAGADMRVSGFILDDSALYFSLLKQFPKLKFWSPQLSVHTESQFPQHFFSPILNLSGCVSYQENLAEDE
jgi:hypothetical protein